MNVTLGSVLASAIFSCGILVIGNFVDIEQSSPLSQSVASKGLSEQFLDIHTTSTYFLQGSDIENMTSQVEGIGGKIIGTYPSLNSINAVLTHSQHEYLARNTDFMIHENNIFSINIHNY